MIPSDIHIELMKPLKGQTAQSFFVMTDSNARTESTSSQQPSTKRQAHIFTETALTICTKAILRVF
jgi:hypothetical protein